MMKKFTENIDFLMQAMVAIVGVEKTKKILIYAEELKEEVEELIKEKEKHE